MPRLDTHGFNGVWPLREFLGKDQEGNKITREVFRDMVTGEIHAPENGWNGAPPKPTGDLSHVRHHARLYRENYDKINWHRDHQEMRGIH